MDIRTGKGNAGSEPAAGQEVVADVDAGYLTACLSCRKRHLKCDKGTPCSRCISSKAASECVYVASQRGLRSCPQPRGAECRRKSGIAGLQDKGEATAMSEGMVLASPRHPAQTCTDHTASAPLPAMQRHGSYFGLGGKEAANSIPADYEGSFWARTQMIPLLPVECSTERCIGSFYHYFFSSHPFVPPQEQFKHLVVDSGREAEPLVAAMAWIGSMFLYVSPSFRDGLYEKAQRSVRDVDAVRRRSGFLIQAMLLLVVGLDGSDKRRDAASLLGEAEELALEAGLHAKDFAARCGRGVPALEESWRRTWWELYVVNGMMAGVHRSTAFALYDVLSEVGLPCEEHQYVSSNIPTQIAYLEEMEDLEFVDSTRSYSSFAFRILAVRNLGAFLQMPRSFLPDHERVSSIEALLTTWRLHLPAEKQESLHQDGSADEMMFQAHMISHATSILLHQPLSELDPAPAKEVTSCAPHDDAQLRSGHAGKLHTGHAVASAAAISNMITHRVPIISHTPFFTCIVGLASIVHLSKWALWASADDEKLRQQVRLNIAALGKLSTVWEGAGKARVQVQAVAREIHRARRQREERELSAWGQMMHGDIIAAIEADALGLGDDGLETLGMLMD
ncbi:hypothetical protein QQS21_012415 [Conoideocrella luteorostrata]|uniref:Zn(2)-C6 fungal-type domain-containing protein n=1 Tax=Conoideocrella luteorostrata TaxID=1105319 RepID=A0AAJ0CCC0_9HYPO|nr:hypothetical protein QQS21_012415 [Conoideocrella luteorostrata]